MEKEMEEYETESHPNENSVPEDNPAFMDSEQHIHIQQDNMSIEDHLKLFQERINEYVAKYNIILQYII